ncbi:integron gene cassette protein [Candidatus Scalindua japonica]|uniref:Integron gene cassette protein n=1 Tax=Candidatus Scalindua japonica TaxID=1284222 RepID=A0A286U0V8_9BACT|nr:hypothetical protein [Candidatus Scalindua japonica]GAX61755.1 integron gene cassette protein [Candidatus Scalindua japonica]
MVRTNYCFSELFWFEKEGTQFFIKQLRNTGMKSLGKGKNISRSEITNISEYGFWILLDKKEDFLPFANIPGSLMPKYLP